MPHTTPAPLCPGEAVRYTDAARWFWNNGLRRRWIQIGERHAAVINAARRSDAAALRRFAETLGGLSQPGTFTRTALAAAAKLPADVLPYRVHNRRIVRPNLTWIHRGRRQVARIEYLPL